MLLLLLLRLATDEWRITDNFGRSSCSPQEYRHVYLLLPLPPVTSLLTGNPQRCVYLLRIHTVT